MILYNVLKRNPELKNVVIFREQYDKRLSWIKNGRATNYYISK